MRTALGALVVALVAAGPAAAQDALPPAPTHHFTDEAGVVSPDVARRLDQKLRDFDTQSSTQIVVAVFPELPSPSLEDFTVRTAQAWKAGRKELDNGAVFFVFVKDRKMRIEVGYGLEGALPDVTAKRILDERVAPRFREGDYAGGLEAGIDGIIAATRGEYTAPPRRARRVPPLVVVLVFLVILVLVVVVIAAAAGSTWSGMDRLPRGRTYSRRGWHSGPWWGGGGFGGGFGGGGFSGGGFSGGGGSFGGGGASSSW